MVTSSRSAWRPLPAGYYSVTLYPPHFAGLRHHPGRDSRKTGNGSASRTTAALTSRGRAALDAYTQALRDLLGGL